MLAPRKKSYDKLGHHIKKQKHHFVDKDPCSQSYGFSSSQVRMWEAEHQRTDAFELCCWRCLSPLDCKEIKPVNPKENHSWLLIGRTDAEAEAPILWPPDAKSRLIGKDPDAGKDWWEKEKRGQRMRCLAHRLIRHEFEQTLGDSGGQRSLVSMGSQRVGPNLETEQQQYLR